MGSNNKAHILVVSDAAALPVEKPMSTTGFAYPAAAVITGLLKAGFWVDHMPRGATVRDVPLGMGFDTYCPPATDPNGNTYLNYLMTGGIPFKPNAIVFIADPTSIMIWRQHVMVRTGIPNICYIALEGAPLMRPLDTAMAEVVLDDRRQRVTPGKLTSYTNFSCQAISKATGAPCEIIPHGNDHARFRRYSNKDRNIIRQAMGWDNKYVLMNVARNAGRKNWTVLFRAVQLLKDKYPNLLLYAHTVPFENFNLGGHDLRAIAERMGIADRVIFNRFMTNGAHGIPYERNEANPLGLIDLYNAADAFVSVSGAEGWGLPAIEAAACGLPVAMTAYAGGWEVARDFAYPIEPFEYETQQSGADYALLRAKDVAEVIEHIMNADPKELKKVTEKGMCVANKLTWRTLGQRMAEIVTETLENK